MKILPVFGYIVKVCKPLIFVITDVFLYVCSHILVIASCQLMQQHLFKEDIKIDSLQLIDLF